MTTARYSGDGRARGHFLSVLIILFLLVPLRPAWSGVEEKREIFVSSNGWHTGIIIAVRDVPDERIPEARDFGGARYLEFGWGDAAFYPAPDPGLGITLRAVVPGPAVIHVSPLNGEPDEVFRGGVEAISISLDRDGFIALVDYIHDSFERGGEKRVWPSARGLYPFSMFYPATGRFHLFNTCNTWTARALAAGGLDINAAGAQRAEDVMVQLRATKMN